MPQTDYAALAEQARRGTPPPVVAAAAGPVDYAALADQARGGHADFSATNEPPSLALKAAAYGKDALQFALDALPGAGAVVGGAVATPETAGAGTLAGAALGAGAGRGLRDLIAAGLGLQKPTTAVDEGGKIALDAGETAIAGWLLPKLWLAIKTPGATVADVVDQTQRLYKVLPRAAKAVLPDFDEWAKVFPALPKGVGKAPATVLERPAAETWEQFIESTKQPTAPIARGTSTSMVPAPMPTSSVAPPPVAPPPAAVAPPPAAAPSAPVAAVAAPTEFQAAQAARANTLPDQKALNDAALAARRAAYQARQASAPAAATPPPAGPVVAASGQMKLTGPEYLAFQDAVKRGVSYREAYAQVMSRRLAAALSGTVTDAEAAQTIAKRRYKS